MPESASKLWTDLTKNERWAAAALGYSEDNWDDNDEKLRPSSYFKLWSQMDEQELTALTILGFTEANWDEFPLALPKSATARWEGLSSCDDDVLVIWEETGHACMMYW